MIKTKTDDWGEDCEKYYSRLLICLENKKNKLNYKCLYISHTAKCRQKEITSTFGLKQFCNTKGDNTVDLKTHSKVKSAHKEVLYVQVFDSNHPQCCHCLCKILPDSNSCSHAGDCSEM